MPTLETTLQRWTDLLRDLFAILKFIVITVLSVTLAFTSIVGIFNILMRGIYGS